VISRHFIKTKLSRAVDPPKYPGSSTFINRLNIRSHKKLSVAEADFSTIRTDLYRLRPFPGDFDLAHLQGIHYLLFQDLDRWAGRCRSYDMKKGDSIFCPARDLQKHATQVFEDLGREDWSESLGIDQFISRLAYFYTLTNKLHPFPEGNGRAQRLFFEHLAAANNYRINWKAAHPWEIAETAVQSFLGRLDPTIYMFERIVEPWKTEPNQLQFPSIDSAFLSRRG